ncbi:copper amine oxidase N-terminal domain protein [Peptoniphilus sp. oral taxon 375 str. F0436]|nr:copper amine oxidase N-terminal domain protein [Peptoniphilus sp. oral taxon 375 str. F0436]
MKKFLSYLQGFTLVSLSLILVGSPIYGQDDPINLIVKGKQTPTDVEPFVENSRTLVPVRALSEALGFQVDWKAEKTKST